MIADTTTGTSNNVENSSKTTTTPPHTTDSQQSTTKRTKEDTIVNDQIASRFLIHIKCKIKIQLFVFTSISTSKV